MGGKVLWGPDTFLWDRPPLRCRSPSPRRATSSSACSSCPSTGACAAGGAHSYVCYVCYGTPLVCPPLSDLTDEFVKAWLMLADVFIDAGKFDQAQDSLQVRRR